MKDKNTPAFPFVAEDESGMMINMGMSLRDYFAARALPTAVKINTHQYSRELGKEWYWDDDEDAAFAASVAYNLADAMLKAREA